MFPTINKEVTFGSLNILYCSEVENNKLKKIMTKWQKYSGTLVQKLNLFYNLGNDNHICVENTVEVVFVTEFANKTKTLLNTFVNQIVCK